MKIIGFELYKDVMFFQRYVLEKNDIGMGAGMKKHLSEDDYNKYIETIMEENH